MKTTLAKELRFRNPIRDPGHEACLAIVRTAQRLQKEAAAVLKPFGLTDSQFNVMMLLVHQAPADGWLTQVELGQMLLVSAPNVTGLVDRLEQAGLAERRDVKGDRRARHICLTKEGRKLAARAEAAYDERLGEIMRNLAPADGKRLSQILAGIRGAL